MFVSVLGSRPGRAFAALALGALVTYLGAAWTGDNWRDSLERHPPIMALLAIILFSGVLAALPCAPTERDAPT